MRTFLNQLILSAVVGTLSSLAMAQTRDASAHAQAGFVQKVKTSKGIVLRVPVNAKGEENVGAAEMRMHTVGKKITDARELDQIWNKAESLKSQPVVSDAKKVDRSTCGWWRHRYYRNYWVTPSYYYNYRPTYYYYGTVYTYRYAYTYTYPTWGYRYYYYW